MGPPFYNFKNFRAFWALDVAPTLAGPGLFICYFGQYYQKLGVFFAPSVREPVETIL